MKQYNRYFSYIEQANSLIYDYYAVHGFGCICYYFNINKQQSIIEDSKLHGGSYEFYGDKSGIRFTKILLLPVYFSEPIQASYVGDERGYIHETESSIVIPSAYGITPYEHDIIYFPSSLNMGTKFPVYEVVSIEKSTDTYTSFFRCHIKSAKTSLDVVQNQVVDVKVWFEPAKIILDADLAEFLYNQLQIISDQIDSIHEKWHNIGIFIPF